jgi:hypothetical protein
MAASICLMIFKPKSPSWESATPRPLSGRRKGTCAERFVRILKENLLWVKTFRTVEELPQALLEFKRTYNENWIIQRHGYKTPAQMRQVQLQAWPLAA